MTRRPNATRRRRLETGNGQWPFAIILTCADSRVIPELIFDQGVGDLFVARVAGNVATSEIIGSIQYAVQELQTKLVVVLGHESCGAVKAALPKDDQPCDEPPSDPPEELVALVEQIQGFIGSEKDIEKAVVKNAKAQVNPLKKALKKTNQNYLKVVAATYGLRSGEVRWHR